MDDTYINQKFLPVINMKKSVIKDIAHEEKL